MAEVAAAEEIRNLAPLPEIVIPETVRSQFTEGIKKIIPLFMSWDEVGECWIDTDHKPNLVITLARAGSLAWIPIQTIVDLYEISIPRIVDVHLGRELAYRFVRESRGDFRLLKNGDPKSVSDFGPWLDEEFSNNSELTKVLSEISNCIIESDQPDTSVVVLDDVVQDGITMGLILPKLIERSLANNVVFESSNKKLQDHLVSRSIPALTGQTTIIQLENILEDTEWLYEIIDATFSNYFELLFQEKKIVARQFLVQLAKGSIENIQTGLLVPITTANQMREIGQNIQQQYLINNRPRHEALSIDPGNPAEEIIKTFGVDALLKIQVAVRKELERLGQTAEL